MGRLVQAIGDSRDLRYITHSMRDRLIQRIFQMASGYEDGNDANILRQDPLFKLAAGRAPLNAGNALTCAATHSRLETALQRPDIYRMARALVEPSSPATRSLPSPSRWIWTTPTTLPMANRRCPFTTTLTGATIATCPCGCSRPRPAPW